MVSSPSAMRMRIKKNGGIIWLVVDPVMRERVFAEVSMAAHFFHANVVVEGRCSPS